MIEVTNLVKHYGDKKAVDGISFSIHEGELVGFLGPNGAGKSTTMNVLTGYLSATSGSAKINGIDILENPIAAKRHIGYLPEQPPLYMDMAVNEYLDFICDLKGVKEHRKEHISEICELAGITNVYKRMIRNLSKGYKQRVGLAQALIGDPEVLILDEPTVGLDPIQIIEIRNVIKDLGKKRTVILSSHILPEVQAICERVLVINHGKIIANDTPANLSSTSMWTAKCSSAPQARRTRFRPFCPGSRKWHAFSTKARRKTAHATSSWNRRRRSISASSFSTPLPPPDTRC